MKQLATSLLLFATVLILGNTSAAASPMTIENADSNDKSERVDAHMNLTPFTGMQSDVVADITFIQSDGEYAIDATGPERIIRLIDVKIKDGLVRITSTQDYKMKRGEKVRLTVYAPTLNVIRQDGVGQVKVPDCLDVETLDIVLNGVGNVKISDLRCSQLNVRANGVGNVDIAGTADNAVYMSDGVGSIDAEDLQADNVTIKLNGVGSVECYANKSIEGHNSGVGSVRYSGNPENVRISNNGVGSVRRK